MADYDPALDEIGATHPAVGLPSMRSAADQPNLPVQSPDPVRQEDQISDVHEERSGLQQRLMRIQAKMELGENEEEQQGRNQRELERVKGLIDACDRDLECNATFGSLLVSSGYRVDLEPVPGSETGCTLDWALIEVLPNRVGHNEVCSLPPPSSSALDSLSP